MEHNSCVVCQSVISPKDEVNIQLTTTKIGQVNVEEFLKETILGIQAHIVLQSNFICSQCFAAVNTLEDHFILYKTIQQTLQEKYFNQSNPSKYIKQEQIEDSNESNPLLLVDSDSNNTQPKLENFEHFEDQTSEDDASRETKVKKSKGLQQRKSNRKRKSIPNYKEEDKMQSKKEKKGSQQDSLNKYKTGTTRDTSPDPPIPAKPEYCCEICGKHYVNYNGWNIHRRKHKNENLIRCEYCDKTFTQRIGLRRHLHMHTGTFPYECNICQKKFIHSSSHKVHMQIHEGKRDFICDTCGMAFYSKTHLRSHINRHTKEKLHACEECGATFTEKYNMRAHRLKLHGIKC